MPDGRETVNSQVPGEPAAAARNLPQRIWLLLRRMGPASILSLIALVSPIIGGLLILATVKYVSGWLRGHGISGIVVYVTTYWVFGGLALLPTYSHSALGGWAFGFWPGLFAAVISFSGASVIAYWVACRASGDRVTALIAENPKWQAVYDVLLKCGFRRALFIITLVRVPFAPFAMTNVLMASARVPLGAFALGTLLGMIPRTAWVAYNAANAEKLNLTEPHQILMFLINLAVSGLVICFIAYLAKRTLDRVTRP
jgi:uncharacterized membrane protein YdjX (TVP38/TMEM64 family)